MRKDQLFEDRTERATSRTFKKTEFFKKGKLEIFGFTRPPSRARDFEQMQEIPPPHFFSSINFEGYPLPDFYRTLSPQRLSAVQYRNERSR